MRKLLSLLGICLALVGCQTLRQQPKSFSVEASTIQVVGVMTPEFMETPTRQLLTVPEGGTAYVYLYSLGGDPRAALPFLDAMEGKTTVCFAHAAGGAAFTILQACTYRLVGDQVSMGTTKIQVIDSGDPEGDAQLRAYAEELTEKFSAIERDRLDISAKEYDELISGEGFIWETPEKALAKAGADAKVDFRCGPGTQKATMERRLTISADEDGNTAVVPLVMTVCPVMRRLVSPDHLSAELIGEIIGVPLYELGKKREP